RSLDANMNYDNVNNRISTTLYEDLQIEIVAAWKKEFPINKDAAFKVFEDVVKAAGKKYVCKGPKIRRRPKNCSKVMDFDIFRKYCIDPEKFAAPGFTSAIWGSVEDHDIELLQGDIGGFIRPNAEITGATKPLGWVTKKS